MRNPPYPTLILTVQFSVAALAADKARKEGACHCPASHVPGGDRGQVRTASGSIDQFDPALIEK